MNEAAALQMSFEYNPANDASRAEVLRLEKSTGCIEVRVKKARPQYGFDVAECGRSEVGGGGNDANLSQELYSKGLNWVEC